MTTLQGADDV